MILINISSKNTLTQTLQIEYVVKNCQWREFTLQLPAWRPGRYELANYAQYLTSLKASSDQSHPVAKKVTKDKWSISNVTIGSDVKVTYEFYAARMDAGSSFIDESQFYLNPINFILYPEEFEGQYTINLDIPDNYQIATSLSKEGNQLIAQDYYELADSPIIASNQLQHNSFQVNGIVFHLWFKTYTEIPWNKLIADFMAYTEKQIDLFGEFPTKEYHYILQLLPYRHYHGVEHRASTVITLGPTEEVFLDKYIDLLGISSHELFHAWNVCKIKPQELTPFDFSKENYFETGYIAEGITTYYGDLMLKKSGVFSDDQYLNELNIYLKRHFDNFGRHTANITDSSIDLWLDGYKRGAPQRKVSIYIKGALLALILDLEIRRLTQNEKSLDSVMRLMWQKYGQSDIGYTSESYQKDVEEVANCVMKDYFDKYIFGTEPLENALNKSFEYVGLQLAIKENETSTERQFGFRSVNKIISVIAPDSPAEQHLMLNDEIISLVEQDKKCLLEVRRHGVQEEISLESSDKTFFDKYFVEHLSEKTAEQEINYKLWLS